MLDDDEYDRWHRTAEHNLSSARVLADAGSHDLACLHAEMAAQLVIKGLLHGIGAGAGRWSLDLVGLGKVLADAIGGELPEELQAGLRGLSRHYIATRYPDAYPVGTPGEHYGAEDADTAIAQAKAVVEFASSWWQRLAEAEVDEEAVLARRRAERAALLDRASRFAGGLDPALGVRAVAVFGSVARGDFNVWSDIDVLVVVDPLPDSPLQRLDLLGPTPPGVQPVAWTPTDWHAQLARHNPIAVEAVEHGVWLVGGHEDL